MADSLAQHAREERLREFAELEGEAFSGGGNLPIRLSDPDELWFVSGGSVDVFAAQVSDSGAPADFKHLLRAEPGRLLFPLREEAGYSVLIAKGLPDSELRRIPTRSAAAADLDDAIVGQADAWVSEISEAISRDVTFRPTMDHRLDPGGVEEAAAGAATSTRSSVVWVDSPDGEIEFVGTEAAEQSGSGLIPVTAATWVIHGRESAATGIATAELQRDRRLFAVLNEFNRLAMRTDRMNRGLLLADLFNLQRASLRHREQTEERARERLFSVVGRDPSPADGDSRLLRALERIGRHEGIAFRAPTRAQRRASSADELTLQDILDASGVRARSIALRDRTRWWLSDSGAMLATRKSDGAPVALVPSASGRYRIVDPERSGSEPVTSARAATLERTAYFFYRPLPDEQASTFSLLFGMVFNRARGDLVRLLGAGTLVGLLSLAPAVVLGVVIDRVLPSGDAGQLVMTSLALVMLGLTLALLQMLQGTAQMRLEGRAAARISAALWDRLLFLPPAFFRRFTAGDLGSRTLGFQYLRDQTAGIVTGALLSVLFLLPTFGLLFAYDSFLGWVCLIFGLATLAVTLYLGWRQLPHHRRLLATYRRLTTVLLQLLGGVSKLRVSGAEPSAFAWWAANYQQQKRVELQLGSINEQLISITAAAPFLATALVSAVALSRIDEGLSIGSFLAIHAAFMFFNGAIAQFGMSFSALAAIVPVVEQASPILVERPRATIADPLMLELQGDLRIEHVTFGYTEDAAPVLQDVSIRARPGEFVALVGESGSGKSTLLRLALGLETPQAGAVYHDGHDLTRIHRQAIRDGVGMVMQDAALRPQTVLDNIIGTGDELSEEDAWRAARLAAVEADILEMPMGMYTMTAEGSSEFSGGQVQRIMLAAALVRSPRLLLLDEATNWLDNETQAQVMQQIGKLSVTRVVSAHRLSTIRQADRIYVLRAGRVIQEGGFDDLVSQDGVFRDMASRQMT